MINTQKQEKHTKLFEIHRILSKHDRKLCKKNNLANKSSTK